MPELHEALAGRVAAWRAAGYPHARYPAIGEILRHAVEDEVPGEPFPRSGHLRYLRAAQLRALETYWYLRLVEGTASIPALYGRLFPTASDRLQALGLGDPKYAQAALDLGGVDRLLERIRADDHFVREHRLVVSQPDVAAVREFLSREVGQDSSPDCCHCRIIWHIAGPLGGRKTRPRAGEGERLPQARQEAHSRPA